MAEKTGIGWTDSTFNGWIGCREVGPGCVPCYARELDRKYQFGVIGEARKPGVADVAPNWTDGRRHRTAVGYWKGPILWNKQAETLGVPRKVFAHSLSDVFDNEAPDEWRADLFDLWRRTPWLRWQILTKRVSNIPKMLPKDWGDGYPNVGFVVTTVNQEEFDRDAGRLLAIPARWHGFSIEPQLGRIIIGGRSPVASWERSIWLITGGESAQGSTNYPMIDSDTGNPRIPVPYDPKWASGLIGASKVKPNLSVFVKQLGAAPIGLPAPRDGAGANPAEWPAAIRVQNFVPELLS